MRRALWILGIITLLTAWHLLKGYIPLGDNTIEYRGQVFRLSKYYTDYDDYKNDPHNLQTEEIPRIQRIMREAPIGPTFKNREEFVHAYCDLSFPGYGGGNMVGDAAQSVIGGSVEIPGLDADRCFTVQKEANHYRLIDDFVNPPGTPLICTVQMVGTTLRYYDYQKRLVREKKLKLPNRSGW